MPKIRELLSQIGILRILMILLAAVVIVLVPDADTETARSGWEMIPTLVVPAMAPIVFMGLMFDVLMSRIAISSEDEVGKQRYRMISRIELITALIILVLWIPFILSLR